MTNIELITQSFRLLNVIDENEAPSAEQGVQGLALLNQMMESWEEEGVKLQYYEQTDQDATFPSAPYTHKGVIGKLAEALAAHYGISMTQEAAIQADDGYAVILRKSISAQLQPADMSHLPQGSNRSGFDIESGNF